MNRDCRLILAVSAGAMFLAFAASAIPSLAQTVENGRRFDLASAYSPSTEVAEGAEGINLIVNGAFGMGNSGFGSQYVFGNDTNPGTYVIGKEPCQVSGHYFDWQCFPSHHGADYNMFIANGGNSASQAVWTETVTVDPEGQYLVNFWAATINTSSSSPAQLALEINGEVLGGVVLPAASPVTGGTWVHLSRVWNSGSSASATVVILDENTATDLNDFVVDDISLVQVSDEDTK
jgi:hypothetical protein